jgi:hypothetical protein
LERKKEAKRQMRIGKPQREILIEPRELPEALRKDPEDPIATEAPLPEKGPKEPIRAQ